MREPKAKNDFLELSSRLLNSTPTTFVRFSDGELEMLRNNHLSITDGIVNWRMGTIDGKYPVHDNKSFVPDRDQVLRLDLIASARYKADGYFKGVPASSNRATSDRDYMIELNGGDLEGLTFSDLLINENYRKFLKEVLPFFQNHNNVIFLGNFRAQVSALSKNWSHIKLADNAFPIYGEVLPKLMSLLSSVDQGSVVLSSASSLTNILGHKLHTLRPDVTFVDVGTSLNPFIGLGQATRAYQSQLLPLSLVNFSRKLKYRIFGNHKMKW